jgi:hypothetical protein
MTELFRYIEHAFVFPSARGALVDASALKGASMSPKPSRPPVTR